MRRLVHFSVSVAFIGVAVAACSPADDAPVTLSLADSVRADSIARARQDSINRTLPGYVVDSILPVEEELRRFRLALKESRVIRAVDDEEPRALTGGTRSRETLVRRFIKALATRDSSAFDEMALTPREFAYLVYPESPYTEAPYRQSPALVWNHIRNASSSGLARLLGRIAGTRLGYVNHSCTRAEHQGANTIWADCTVRLVDRKLGTTHQRLFGSIIERNGTFKFVSYSNGF
jgi:hypothetical protein